MPPPETTLHLPNGQTVNVKPIFGGYSFKANNLNVHHSVFPPGWSVIINTKDSDGEDDEPLTEKEKIFGSNKHPTHKFTRPTLQHDHIYISTISNPSSTDFKPAASPTRQIAMMLWTSLWWYFHLPAPSPHLPVAENPNLPEEGRPKGQWKINVRRDGILKGKRLLPKLERMGLIATEESCAGASLNDKGGDGWNKLFVSQCAFWQIDARIFLFTLSPTHASPFPGSTPFPSRPGSPVREGTPGASPKADGHAAEAAQGLWGGQSPGPFASGSHLPTYYPPPPPQYTFTDSIRHPLRQKPPSQGTTFYTRYIPSLGQYISFRTVSLSSKAPSYQGPMGTNPSNTPPFLPPNSGVSHTTLPSITNLHVTPSDTELLHDWMNQPRVSAMWGLQGPIEVQEKYLQKMLNDRHSFPVIGCFDGRPFGYFEIYWVKEDPLGRFVTGRESSHYDRGLHALVGEQEFRGPHRVKVWISALVHYCWLADNRTQRVLLEPRVDNQKFIGYLKDVGFYKEKEVCFPHKQAALMKIVREGWEAPER